LHAVLARRSFPADPGTAFADDPRALWALPAVARIAVADEVAGRQGDRLYGRGRHLRDHSRAGDRRGARRVHRRSRLHVIRRLTARPGPGDTRRAGRPSSAVGAAASAAAAWGAARRRWTTR